MFGYYLFETKTKRQMKTLSIKQPWASLICAGVKDVENRTWAPPQNLIGKKILIHAGSTKVPKDFFETIPFEWCSEIANATSYGWIPSNDSVPLGAIIGYATLAGFSPETDSLWDGGEGLIKWKFEDPYLFDEPIPAKGMLGLFDYPLEEDNLPAAHKVRTIEPHLEGTEAVFPVEDALIDDLRYNAGPFFDVTDSNASKFFDLAATDDDGYHPWPVSSVRLVSSKRTVAYPVECVETYADTYADTGEPIFYTSLGGEEYVKLIMCFVLKRSFS